MEKEYVPDKCNFCGSQSVEVEAVDQNIGDFFAVQCHCCWAEGSHCVSSSFGMNKNG